MAVRIEESSVGEEGVKLAPLLAAGRQHGCGGGGGGGQNEVVALNHISPHFPGVGILSARAKI